MATARIILAENIDRLEPRDQGFASSLLSAPFPSPTQESYIERLAKQAMPRPAQRISHTDRIFGLFDHAANHISRPGISLRLPDFSLRIERHRDVLKLSNAFRSHRDRIWYGDLSRDGTYDPHTAEADNVATVLRAFAQAPLAMAQNHGYRTGYCCFCGLQLTDEERSVSLGYGPVCAKHWGLACHKVATVEKPKPPVKLEISPREREPKFDRDEPPIADADGLRTVDFANRLMTEHDKAGRIVAQIPANWLIVRPHDQGDIRARLAAFLTEHGISHDGGWRGLPVKYTAPSGRRSNRDWVLFVVRVSERATDVLAQFPSEVA